VTATGAGRVDGWRLDPDGGLVHEAERLAVVADVHLGYEWARGRGGDCVPAHSLAETQAKLGRLLSRAAVDRLVVAGDLVESPRPCRRTSADVAALTRWLGDRGVTLVPLAGNHDPRRVPALAESLEVDGWTIAHGHKTVDAPRTITGHEHPVLRAGGVSVPCFLVGPSAIVLPAFSPNAAGLNVASEAIPSAWRDGPFRCIVPSGDDWLDFGPPAGLGRRLRVAPGA
jgi:uncharacterized protein